MKVYTKGGDKGQTSLLGGTRVPKHHLRIEAYGTVDELNSWIGMLKDHDVASSFGPFLKNIQDQLFTLGSHLASDPDSSRMKLPEILEEDVLALENSIDEMELELPALKNFVLPGGHPASSSAHVARCVCRRAERLVVHLAENSTVEEVILRYLNRLSDWLFVFSRMLIHLANAEEIVWSPRTSAS